MTDLERRKVVIAHMRKRTAELTKTEALARHTMIKEGIYNSRGKLKARYSAKKVKQTA